MLEYLYWNGWLVRICYRLHSGRPDEVGWVEIRDERMVVADLLDSTESRVSWGWIQCRKFWVPVVIWSSVVIHQLAILLGIEDGQLVLRLGSRWFCLNDLRLGWEGEDGLDCCCCWFDEWLLLVVVGGWVVDEGDELFDWTATDWALLRCGDGVELTERIALLFFYFFWLGFLVMIRLFEDVGDEEEGEKVRGWKLNEGRYGLPQMELS
jgi:hypothetical protein